MKQIQQHNEKKILLFGAGAFGRWMMKCLPEIKWDRVCDNHKAGVQMNEYTVVSFDSIKQDCQGFFYIISIEFQWRSVYEQLMEAGVNESDIFSVGKYIEEHQYFDLPELKLGKQEVFVDAGGFDGSTSEMFIRATHGEYDHICIFEPGSIEAARCEERLKEYHDVKIVRKALWDSAKTLCFNENGHESYISQTGDKAIETVSLDSKLNGGPVTYIKMDIEGAEIHALKGAMNTIRQHKPKLAISVYHSRNDIWAIPRLILDMCPDYKLYLRMYAFTGNEVVLYAL